jgi:hypothetical protein
MRLFNITEDLRLSDLRLSDIPSYPTCRVGPVKADRMSHSEGLNSIQTSRAYVKQQSEATAADVLPFRRRRDLGKVSQKQIHITHLKNKLFYLHFYTMLNNISVCDIFI